MLKGRPLHVCLFYDSRELIHRREIYENGSANGGSKSKQTNNLVKQLSAQREAVEAASGKTVSKRHEPKVRQRINVKQNVKECCENTKNRTQQQGDKTQVKSERPTYALWPDLQPYIPHRRVVLRDPRGQRWRPLISDTAATSRPSLSRLITPAVVHQM